MDEEVAYPAGLWSRAGADAVRVVAYRLRLEDAIGNQLLDYLLLHAERANEAFHGNDDLLGRGGAQLLFAALGLDGHDVPRSRRTSLPVMAMLSRVSAKVVCMGISRTGAE